MGAITSTGTIMSVAAAQPATFDQVGYEALSFTEVGEVLSIAEYGATTQVVTHEPLKTGVTEKFKGFINYGQASAQLAYDSSDAGQAILKAGSDGATRFQNHSIKIEYSDGSVDYLDAGIFSYTKNPSGANSMVGSSVGLEVNRAPVEVAAP